MGKKKSYNVFEVEANNDQTEHMTRLTFTSQDYDAILQCNGSGMLEKQADSVSTDKINSDAELKTSPQASETPDSNQTEVLNQSVQEQDIAQHTEVSLEQECNKENDHLPKNYCRSLSNNSFLHGTENREQQKEIEENPIESKVQEENATPLQQNILEQSGEQLDRKDEQSTVDDSQQSTIEIVPEEKDDDTEDTADYKDCLTSSTKEMNLSASDNFVSIELEEETNKAKTKSPEKSTKVDDHPKNPIKRALEWLKRNPLIIVIIMFTIILIIIIAILATKSTHSRPPTPHHSHRNSSVNHPSDDENEYNWARKARFPFPFSNGSSIDNQKNKDNSSYLATERDDADIPTTSHINEVTTENAYSYASTTLQLSSTDKSTTSEGNQENNTVEIDEKITKTGYHSEPTTTITPLTITDTMGSQNFTEDVEDSWTNPDNESSGLGSGDYD